MSEPEKTSVIFPDWVMLDRTGTTTYYDDGDRVHEDLKKAVDPAAVGVRTTVVEVDTSSGSSGYFSFTLVTPPRVSYLNLYWPTGQTKSCGFPIDPAYASVLAADKNLVLLRIAIPSLRCFNHVPHDLFVYTAAGPRPSLKQLPLHDVPAPKLGSRKCFVSKGDIGILRLAGEQGHYVVADLSVSNGDHKIVQLCVFSSASKTRRPWTVFADAITRPSDGRQFPVCWSTSAVLPFDGRFLCWVDHYSGLLLADFSKTNAPTLRFVPFPGQKYTDEVLRSFGRCCPDRFRSVSISQGMMRFVHIDNNFHRINRIRMGDEKDNDNDDTDHGISDPKITMYTLNIAEFKWEIHRQIPLEKIWAQPIYQCQVKRPCRLPEFPVIAVDSPDLVWCLLREEEFSGKAWVAVVDMKRAKLRSCTPYVDEQPYRGQNMELKNSFANVPPLPTVFSKYLYNTTACFGEKKRGKQVEKQSVCFGEKKRGKQVEKQSGILGESNKFATCSSKKSKVSMYDLEFRRLC